MEHSEHSPPLDLDHVRRVACESALAGAEILLKYFGQVQVFEKSTQNLLTTADLESEQTIAAAVRNAFPDHAYLGEEAYAATATDVDHLWVVDPLDATNNFAHGIPHFCISIAYAYRGRMQVGVVYDPIRREMFAATRGQGAELNERPIHVSTPADIRQAIVATGFYYERGHVMERTLDALRELFRANIRGMRRMGAAALDLSWVACGRMQAFFEYKLAPWDYAAGWLIVEEAGGICTDKSGEPMTIDAGSIIASSPSIHDEMVRLSGWRN